MSDLDIVKRPLCYAFAANELRELEEMLRSIHENTVVTPITRAADVLLNPETGKTPSGFSYTDIAMTQLCSFAAMGLSQVFYDLVGRWRKTGETSAPYSRTLAVDTFNSIIKFRFQLRLLGMQLVKDGKHKTIDGIVGARYRYLANADFLTHIVQVIKTTGVVFSSALLYGRQLVVRSIKPTSQTSVKIGKDTYGLGYHFGNAEIGGTSVRSALTVNLLDKDAAALSPFYGQGGGRVIHSGRDFEKRLNAMLTIVSSAPLASDAPQIRHLSDHGDRLMGRLLDFTPDNKARRLKQLANVLSKKKLTLSFATRAVNALLIGDKKPEDFIFTDKQNEKQRLAQLNAYDLFKSLIVEAKSLPIDQRETAEQVAYNLLTGKTVI